MQSLEACAPHRLVKNWTFHLSQATDALAAARVLAGDIDVLKWEEEQLWGPEKCWTQVIIFGRSKVSFSLLGFGLYPGLK